MIISLTVKLSLGSERKRERDGERKATKRKRNLFVVIHSPNSYLIIIVYFWALSFLLSSEVDVAN